VSNSPPEGEPPDTPTSPSTPNALAQAASGMTYSASLLNFIAQQESFSATAYPDPPGQTKTYSIGYGCQVDPANYPNGISRADALSLLQARVAIAQAGVRRLVKVPLTQGQFDALCDFAFNEGVGALQSSTLLRLLNAGDYDAALDQFPYWDKVEKAGQLVDDPDLLRRRKLEQAMFAGPSQPADVA
jgi:lysozyme